MIEYSFGKMFRAGQELLLATEVEQMTLKHNQLLPLNANFFLQRSSEKKHRPKTEYEMHLKV